MPLDLAEVIANLKLTTFLYKSTLTEQMFTSE